MSDPIYLAIVKVYDFTKEVGDKLGAAFVNYKFTADVYRTYEIKQNYTKSSYDVSTSVLDTDTGVTSFIRNDTYIVNRPSGDEYRGAKVKVEFGKFKFNR